MISKTFNILCLLSCIIVVIYICSFTQDRYVSKSQFSVVVKDTSNVDLSSGLASMLSSGAVANTDTQAAIGFISSADLLQEIEKEFDLVKHYSAPKTDFIFRLASNAPIEDRLAYYREHIIPEYNSSTGLIDLQVDTFSPELSFKISQKILSKTELFINTLNKDVAERRMGFVKQELKRSHDTIKSADKALLDFQSKHQIINPDAIIQARLESIQTLKLDLIRKEIELTTLKTSSPNAPNIRALKISIQELQLEIEKQERTFTSKQHENLSQILSEYRQLVLNMEFSQKLREGSEILLEKTRAEAISNSRFFSLIQNPYLAEEYTHPRRLYLSFTVTAIILLSFYIIRSLLMSIFDRV